MDFRGLSAFTPTPFDGGRPDVARFAALVARAAAAGADSIGALGSTGHYAYLPVEERIALTRVAVEAAAGTPVLVSIGALSTREVVELAAGVQEAGASGVLLAPLAYQPLTREEVFGLYADVTAQLSVPLCVYDNPVVTRFDFDAELYAEIAALPMVASVKIPGVPPEPAEARARVLELRTALPEGVSIGVSGDQSAVTGLLAGCDGWYSVIAGVLPALSARLHAAAAAGEVERAREIEAHLAPVFALFSSYGSARVAAELALALGLGGDFLPSPLRRIPAEGRAAMAVLAPGLAALEG